MKRDYLIVTVLLFFLLGVSLVSNMVVFSVVSLLMAMAVLAWIVFLWGRVVSGRERRFVLLLALVAMLIGAVRFSVDYLLFPLEFHRLDGVQMMVLVAGLPERSGRTQDLQLQILSVDQPGVSGREQDSLLVGLVGSRVMARLPAQMVIGYGDRFLLAGSLVGAGNENINPNLRQKLLRQKLWGLMEPVVVEKRFGNKATDLWKTIFDWRAGLIDFYSLALSEPAASLVNGVLIGERSNIPEDLATAFQITGLTHILAISGFNITLIINLLIVFTGSWPRTLRVTGTILLIGLFVVLTGASASVVRAAVMGILFLLVKNLGRRVKAFKAILLSVFLIVLVEPRLLNFDISFQLSVLATLSLIFFSSALATVVKSGWKQLIWEGMATTLAAQVITLPFIFYHFGTISLISPVANLLIGPLIPLLMLMGVLVLGAGLLPGPLVMVMAGLTQLLVTVMTTVIMTLSKLPLAQMEFGQGVIWLILLYYGLLFILSRKYKLVPDFL